MLVERVAAYIRKEDLLIPGEKVVIALSGGADSVALLHILLALGYNCEAAHCNFHLRGEESDRDEAFVRDLCHSLKIPVHVMQFDTQVYAREKHLSVEMAARELRYTWFDDLLSQLSASAIAVAHHQDDSVETLLLNLIRGTGIHGLRGIPARNGSVVRPLLCITREELISFLDDLGQKYVTDSTNLSNEYTRNKIRLDLLPLLREINPEVDKKLAHTSQYLRQVSIIYDQAMEAARQRVQKPEGIHIRSLFKEVSPETVLFEILYPLGFPPAQIRKIFHSLQGRSGKQFTGTKGWKAVKDRELLLLVREDSSNETPPFQILTETIAVTPDFVIPREKQIACVDADKVVFPLEVRKWKQGDKFIPLGMKGKKLVSDFLTDLKFSLPQKEKQWVVCSDEKIIWVIGERIDNRFRINEQTKSVLVIRTVPLKPE